MRRFAAAALAALILTGCGGPQSDLRPHKMTRTLTLIYDADSGACFLRDRSGGIFGSAIENMPVEHCEQAGLTG